MIKGAKAGKKYLSSILVIKRNEPSPTVKIPRRVPHKIFLIFLTREKAKIFNTR
jgi:hypothetical protein